MPTTPSRARPGAFAFSALAAVALPLALIANAVMAAPTPLKADETITINAPPDKVWATLKDFGALQNWHPAIAESPATNGNAPGSVRHIKIKGGGELTETLVSHNDKKMTYTYRLANGGALPVRDYVSTITVTGQGNQSMVDWRGSFTRANPLDNPSPDMNDQTAVSTMTSVYKGGLANLKKMSEAR